MTRTATLTFTRHGDAEEITLGQFAYQLKGGDEHAIPMSTLSAAVTIPESTDEVRLESACVEHNGNTSFAIFFAGEQILLLACRWDHLPPHISVRLPPPIVDAWLQVYCQTT